MNEKQDKTTKPVGKVPQYQKPRLTPWGTLRELTKGGGGDKKEPTSGRKTRF